MSVLDCINDWIDVFGMFWTAIFTAPLHGSLTWGYFCISVAVMGILISFFIARFK